MAIFRLKAPRLRLASAAESLARASGNPIAIKAFSTPPGVSEGERKEVFLSQIHFYPME